MNIATTLVAPTLCVYQFPVCRRSLEKQDGSGHFAGTQGRRGICRRLLTYTYRVYESNLFR